MKRQIVIASTGASGAVYMDRLLSRLALFSGQFDKCGVVFSNNAKDVWNHELDRRVGDPGKKFRFYANDDFFAPFASGSARYDTMIIMPCSMGTLGRIASGVSDCLITRAADVILKEQRRLVLVVRESPFSLIHLRNMTEVTKAGAVVCPAAPSFYSHPKGVEEMIDTVVNRVLDVAGIQNDGFRWQSQ